MVLPTAAPVSLPRVIVCGLTAPPSEKRYDPLAEMDISELQSRKSSVETLSRPTCIDSSSTEKLKEVYPREDLKPQTPDGAGTSSIDLIYSILCLPVKVKSRSNWDHQRHCISVRPVPDISANCLEGDGRACQPAIGLSPVQSASFAKAACAG